MLEGPVENEARFEAVPCPIGCPPSDEHVLFGVDRLYGLPGEFRVVRCNSCGLMRTSPRPSEVSIGNYYPAAYEPHQVVSRGLRQHDAFSRWLKRYRPRWLRNRHIPSIVPGRLLEVGCGSGRYLAEMKESDWLVKGVETSPRAAAAARGLGFEVHCGPLRTVPPDWKPFELVTAWMAVEHLHDPVSDLARLREVISDRGWLVLSVPDAGGRLGFRLFGTYWYALSLPTHLFHYTPTTIARVLEAAGWRPEKIYWQHDATDFFMSLHYWFLEHRLVSLAGLCDKIAHRRGNPLVAGIAVLFGAFHCSGRMVVWAQPKSNSKEEPSALR